MKKYSIKYNEKINKKIAIIGSGPSGIITAKKLLEKGYNDITIYGIFEDSQVKTFNIDGVIFDIQACFLHIGYNNSVKKLCDEYGFKTSIILNYDIRTKKKINNFNIFDLINFVIKTSKFFETNDPKILSMSAYDFSKKYKINLFLKEVFLNAQLYGYPKDITLYSALSWYKTMIPELKYIFEQDLSIIDTTIINKGYGNLFKTILNSLNVKKKKNLIKKVENKNGINLLTLDNNEVIEYDKVIIACPYLKLKSPVSEILNSNDIEYTKVFLLVYKSKINLKNIAVYYNIDDLKKNKYNTIIALRYFGKNKENEGIIGAIGYVSKEANLIELKKNIINQTKTICKIPLEKEIYWDIYDYNYRWTSNCIFNGNNKKAEKLQGKNNIWYTTSPFCHWNIDSIYEYVSDIINKNF